MKSVIFLTALFFSTLFSQARVLNCQIKGSAETLRFDLREPEIEILKSEQGVLSSRLWYGQNTLCSQFIEHSIATTSFKIAEEREGRNLLYNIEGYIRFVRRGELQLASKGKLSFDPNTGIGNFSCSFREATPMSFSLKDCYWQAAE